MWVFGLKFYLVLSLVCGYMLVFCAVFVSSWGRLFVKPWPWFWSVLCFGLSWNIFCDHLLRILGPFKTYFFQSLIKECTSIHRGSHTRKGFILRFELTIGLKEKKFQVDIDIDKLKLASIVISVRTWWQLVVWIYDTKVYSIACHVNLREYKVIGCVEKIEHLFTLKVVPIKYVHNDMGDGSQN